jgi:ligand-binding SRPBCC domain-containing protein
MNLPPTFTISFEHIHRSLYRLTASQVLPLPRKDAFVFFEDPRNLSDITPDWLRFKLKDRETKTVMCEGAVFDYTIRWSRIRLPWRSRIEGYLPPERFTDIQIAGPFRSWGHLHLFEEHNGGTLMRDVVTYLLPFGPLGSIAHRIAVRRQLDSIFRYRAARIDAWARGISIRKP